jgi:hypothetical protein
MAGATMPSLYACLIWDCVPARSLTSGLLTWTGTPEFSCSTQERPDEEVVYRYRRVWQRHWLTIFSMDARKHPNARSSYTNGLLVADV